MSSTHLRKAAITLFVCVFSLLAESAFATHFRYGYIFWERDLTYVNPSKPNEVKLTVTIEGGGRWSYPWIAANMTGYTSPRCTGTASTCCAGAIVTGTTGSGSCPPLGALVNWSGNQTGTLGFWSPTAGQTVTVVARHGITLAPPIHFSSLAATNPEFPVATTPLDVVVNQVSLPEDTFYGRYAVTILMDKTKPLHLTWRNGARLSQLLDFNNDIEWKLAAIVDLTGANASLTKSPKSSMSAVSTVFTARDNTIVLPSVTFDNLTARWRVATSGESALSSTTPAAPSVFTLNGDTGEVMFRPRINGFYAVQFRLAGVDANGVERVSVPVDVMFQAVTATATYSNTLATTDGQDTYTATVGQPISFTMRSTLTPPVGTFMMNVNNTILPAGAVATGGSCSGTTGTCDKLFTWTPTVNSSSASVCFTGVVTSGATVITTSAQKCVTVNLNPLETRMTVFPTEGTAGGGPLVLRAKLERVYQAAPLPGRTVNFIYDANPTNPPWIGNASAVTDVNGFATATVTTVGAVNPPSPYTAKFEAIANEYLAASSGSDMVSIKAATTSMNAPTFQPVPTIGYPITTSALLNRIFTDGGTLAVGADVQFTLSGPGVLETSNGITGANGVATVTFPTTPVNVGPYTVEAKFSGNGALFPNADGTPTTNSTTLTLKRRTLLTFQPVTAVAGHPATVTVSLTELPSNTIGLGNRTVQLSGAFNGGSATATTNLNGVATFNVTFPTATNVNVVAAYVPWITETNRLATAGNETASQSVAVTIAATQLAFAPAPSVATVGQPLAVNATLNRTTGAVGPVGSATITFVLSRPGGSTVVQTAATNASGLASVTFPGSAFNVAGAYSLTASFMATATMAAASAGPVGITATSAQLTALSVSPVSTTSGQNTAFSATLTVQGSGVPMVGVPVSFTIVGGASLGNATTDGAGVATISIPAGSVFSGQYRADFAGTPGYAPSAATASYVISPATTSVSVPTVAATNFVGDTITASATVTRTSAPAGAVAGETVSFTISGAAGNPGGATSQIFNTTTNAAGVAQVTFPATARGQFTVTASYAGTASLSASTSGNAATTVYQRFSLNLSNVTGVAGLTTQASAQLLLQPGNTPFAGQSLEFAFPGSISSGAVTGADGTATVDLLFENSGIFSGSVIFSGGHDNFLDGPVTRTGSAVIGKATSSTSAPIVAGTPVVGQPLTVSATVSRVTAPAGPVAGEQVTFTVTGPGGSIATSIATTNANGTALASINLTARGDHTVSASFLGSASLNQSTSTATAFSAAQPTTLTLAPVVAIAGGQATISATVTAVPQGTPVANEAVTFSWNGGSMSAPTDASGVATVHVTFPSTGLQSVLATLVAGNNYNSSSNSQSVVVEAAMASLSALSVPSTSMVGDSLVVATTLTRTSAPLSNVAGASVMFTLENANAGLPPQTLVAMTDGNGIAQTSFNLISRGAFTVTAQFAGDAALTPSQVSAGTSVYQKTALLLNAAHGIAGSPTQLAAQLVTLPDNSPLNGQQVEFSIGGDGTASAVTGGNGIALGSLTFNTAGTFAATAAFNGLADYFVDANGNAVPTTASASVTIVRAATALDALTAPGSSTVGNNVTVNTLLTRISAPAGTVAGAPVAFTVTAPDGSTSVGQANSDANGLVSYTFAATMRGMHTISASFAGTDGLDASAANNVVVTVFQRTTLSFTTSLTGLATRPLTLSAKLSTEPGGLPVANQAVTLSFNNLLPGVTLTTDAMGVVTHTVTFPAVGTFPVRAEFFNGAAFFTADGLPATPTVADAALTVTNTPPTFTPPANIVTVATGPNGATVNFDAIGNDAEDGPITAACWPARNTVFAIGTTPVTCTVTDAAGDTATGEFTVTVTNTAPTFTPPASVTVEATGGSGAVVDFTAAGDDLEDGTLSAVCSPVSGSTFPVGSTTVSCTVTDVALAVASGSFTVTVADTTAPVLTLPVIAPAFAASSTGNVVNFAATAVDIVDGARAVTCTPASGSTFPIATTTVNCSVSDTRGNTSTGSFDVAITNTAPTIVDLPNLTGEATSASGRAFTFTSTGNDAEEGALAPVCTASSGTFPIGTTTVSCTVTDVAGYTATDSFTITVVDTTAPVVTYTGNAGTYTADQTINITCAATDSGSGVATTTCQNVTGPAHTFAVGVNTRTASATDVAGNIGSATITFTVTVPPAAVGNVITQFFDSPTEAAKANQTLNQATSAPNASARAAHLNKLKKDIEKEIGKTLTAAEAATLISLLNNLY